MGNSGSTNESVLPEVKERCSDIVRYGKAENTTMVLKLLRDTISMLREKEHVYMKALVEVLSVSGTEQASGKEDEDVSGEFVRVVTNNLLTFKKSSVRRLALALLESLHTSVPSVYDNVPKERRRDLERERSRLCVSLREVFGRSGAVFENLKLFFTEPTVSSKKKILMSEVILENDRKLVLETNDSKIDSHVLRVNRDEKSLALRALKALAYRCDRNQSASRKCGLIQTVATFLFDKDWDIRKQALDALEVLACEYNLSVFVVSGVADSLLKMLAFQVGSDPMEVRNSKSMLKNDDVDDDDIQNSCALVAQRILSRIVHYPILNQMIATRTIDWGEQGCVSGLNIFFVLLSVRLRLPRLLVEEDQRADDDELESIEKLVRCSSNSMRRVDCIMLVDVAAAISSLMAISDQKILRETLESQVLPIARSRTRLGLTNKQILMLALRILTRDALLDRLKNEASSAALWIGTAVLQVQLANILSYDRYDREIHVGDVVRIVDFSDWRGREGIVMQEVSRNTVKVRLIGSSSHVKNFLRSTLEHTRRDFFFGESRIELCGFRNEGEIYETIPNSLSKSRLGDVNEDDHEHEHVPQVAIARVLESLARSEGFASRHRVLKNVRFARKLCSPSPKRAIVRILAELLNVVREVKDWKDTDIRINMKHTKRRIKYLVAKSVALLSLGSTSTGGEKSWSSVISFLDDEDNNVMILRFLERGATRACFRWKAMIREELESGEYADIASSPKTSNSSIVLEDNDKDDFDVWSNDGTSGLCCGGSPSTKDENMPSDDTLLQHSACLKRCDSMCLVAMSNLITSCSESSLLSQNLISRLSRARKIFEVDLEQTDIPKTMCKKKVERVSKSSKEAMYNLLFTGIESWLSNDKQSETVRARIQFDVDRVFQDGDMHSLAWQMMFLISESSVRNDQGLQSRLRNAILASTLASRLQSRYNKRKIRVSKSQAVAVTTNQEEISSVAEMILSSKTDKSSPSFSMIMKHVSNLAHRNEHKAFLNPNKNQGAEGLVAAVEMDDVILLDALLSCGSFLHPAGRTVSTGETAIHAAARNGRVRCMRYLLRHLSNRSDRSGFMFTARLDGEVPKRTALAASLGLGRDYTASTHTDYHNDCLEQICCFSRDMMDVTEYGPTSYDLSDSTEISICSYLSAATRACANSARTMMYSTEVKFDDANMVTELVKMLQNSVEISALALRNERLGPSPWTHSLRLLSMCCARPVYRNMKLITWLASKETIGFRVRNLNSPWVDLADFENNVITVSNNDTTVIVRLCRVGPHKGRDDVYVRLNENMSIESLYSLIRHLASLKECPHCYSNTIHILYCGKVYKCTSSKTFTEMLHLRHRSLIQFSISGCNCDAILVKFKKGRGRNRYASEEEARELLEHTSTRISPSAPLLVPSAPMKEKEEEEEEEEKEEKQQEKYKEQKTTDDDEEYQGDVMVDVDMKSNVIMSSAISPPNDDAWSITMRVRLSCSSEDYDRSEPKVWSLVELETKQGHEIWHVVCVLHTSRTHVGLGLGLVRGTTVTWNRKSWSILRSNMVGGNFNRVECAEQMPWLYRFYSMPTPTGESTTEKMMYLTIIRNDLSSFEPFTFQVTLGAGVQISKPQGKLPAFRFKSFRVHDNLDLMRTCNMTNKPPPNPTKSNVPSFLLLTRSSNGKERLYSPSYVEGEFTVVEYLSQCKVPRLCVLEVRVWDRALYTFAKDSRQKESSDQFTELDTRAADLNESQTLSRYEPTLENDLPLLALRRAVHDSGAMSSVMQFTACDSLEDEEISRFSTEIVRRVSMMHKRSTSLLVHHAMAREALGNRVLQPRRRREYRTEKNWDNISGVSVV